MIDPNKLSVNSAPTGALVLPAGLLNQITCVGFRSNSGDFLPERRNTAGLLSTVVMAVRISCPSHKREALNVRYLESVMFARIAELIKNGKIKLSLYDRS